MQQISPEEWERATESLMQRLLKAGMIRSYSSERTPSVVWNKDYHAPMGGRAGFLGLAILLAELCPNEPLSIPEQAVLQGVRQCEQEADDAAQNSAN